MSLESTENINCKRPGSIPRNATYSSTLNIEGQTLNMDTWHNLQDNNSFFDAHTGSQCRKPLKIYHHRQTCSRLPHHPHVWLNRKQDSGPAMTNEFWLKNNVYWTTKESKYFTTGFCCNSINLLEFCQRIMMQLNVGSRLSWTSHEGNYRWNFTREHQSCVGIFCCIESNEQCRALTPKISPTHASHRSWTNRAGPCTTFSM